MSEKLDDDLLEEDLVRFAIKQYYTPLGIDFDEFYTDLKRFQYVKRLLNRYCDYGKLGERLVLNHLIIIFNVFGYYGGLKILGIKLDKRHWPVIKPFLLLYLCFILRKQISFCLMRASNAVRSLYTRYNILYATDLCKVNVFLLSI